MSEEKTEAAAAIAAISLPHFHQARRDNQPNHSHAQTSRQIQPTTTRLQQHRRKQSSTLTASYTRQTQTPKSAMDLSAPYTLEQRYATRDDATLMGKGETAEGDAVDRRRPPN